MSQEIHIYGGRARRGSITLIPLSTEARELVGGNRYTAFLKEFPDIKYSTLWGDWDKSNSAYIAGKIATFAGAGDGIPGKLVRMLAGDRYVPPILTDKWTQLSASLDEEGAYIQLDLSIIVYPIINNVVHVEGLRKDSSNLIEIVQDTTSMFKWLELGKKCMMPKVPFSTKVLADNVKAVLTTFHDKDSNGNFVLNDRGKKTVAGLKKLGGGIIDLEPMTALRGAEEAFTQIVGIGINDELGQRIGSSFGVIIRDTDNIPLLNSADGCNPPLDFFIKEMEFEFSPHVVRIMKNGKRCGCCPEFCEVKLSLQSVCKVLPTQIVNMCSYGG